MTSHRTDVLSLVLGLVVTGLGVLGLLFANGELADPSIDLRFLGPVALASVAALVAALTVSARRGEVDPTVGADDER